MSMSIHPKDESCSDLGSREVVVNDPPGRRGGGRGERPTCHWCPAATASSRSPTPTAVRTSDPINPKAYTLNPKPYTLNPKP
jgi:hypothetical protein